jgi:hypothetical protein
MHRSLLLCLGLAWLLSSSAGSAAIYYCATDGDDDAPGTMTAPWQNVQDALDRLKPGDTLRLKAGTYVEKLYFNRSGLPDLPITLEGVPGAVISGRGAEGENLIYLEDKSHIRIIGLELRDNLKCNDGSGIRIFGSGSHLELRNNKIHDITGKDAMGITVYGTDADKPVEHLVIDGNEIFDCQPAESEALTLNGNVRHFKVTNNHVHDCNNIGIDFIGGEEWMTKHPEAVTRDGVCKGNRVFRCRSNYGGGYAAGIYVDCGKNIVIEENIVSGCDIGIEVGAENKGCVASGITVKANFIYHNQKGGLVFGGYEKKVGRVEKCQFIGNTCYENGKHATEHNGEIWVQWASDNDISGNTVVALPGTPLVAVDNGGKLGNRVNSNRYHTEGGAAAAEFNWGGDTVQGFAEWQRQSTWDAATVFAEVKVKLPIKE